MKRPLHRSDCIGSGWNARRPCPFVGCKYHLYLDVDREGVIRINGPEAPVWEMPQTCALDVAALGGCTLALVGKLMHLTKERVRQFEALVARRKFRHQAWAPLRHSIRELLAPEPEAPGSEWEVER